MLTRYPKLVLTVLLFINIIAYVDRSMLLGFSPQITQDLSLTNTQFGFLSGAAWVLSYSVMVLVFGTLADRYSRTVIIAGGMLIWSFCTAASGLANGFGAMLAARFLVAAGEAALVPSATAILADLFDQRRRSTANGLFFMGIPLGIGLAYLLSGTVGASIGWRGTFLVLGGLGVAMALGVALVRDTGPRGHAARGENFLPQLGAVLRCIRSQPALILVLAGFVVVHLVLAESTFLQLWLVRERGAAEAQIARQIGMLQIAFGCVGAAGGGYVADRLARGSRWRLALFPALSTLLCAPLMLASRFVAADSALLTVGLAASAFLPFSVYGSALSLIQGSVPGHLRASIVGFTMMCINVIALALGTLLLGFASDRMAAFGVAHPLTTVLMGTDMAVGLAAVCFGLAARQIMKASAHSHSKSMATREA
ncbi:MFS transporter [Duganella sp. FT3S]|uniref:MFS transporter n=1 Tax=Rugamonas fusca TaxID=2758568 RepID=A0A7W2EIA3_9BURK|nr:MFS transporter [Rugamonas fusca]MBA5606428.1 MFS transporter [Rugamonas fusca]